MSIKCKRIIGGKTYNTETATEIHGSNADGGDFDLFGESGEYLYQTRFGAFFSLKYIIGVDENDFEIVEPLTPDEAREWLESKASWNTELIEKLFGEMPEAGSGEIKFTLRLPESLRNRLASTAKENNQSLNAWMVRCLERCVGEGEKQ